MGRYRVNVECSQKLPQTKSEYFTHCSYEVQAISKGVAKAMADTLAEKIGIRAGEITKWMRPAGLLRVPSARLQQLAVALDGGVLVTADGVEVELYGSGGNA